VPAPPAGECSPVDEVRSWDSGRIEGAQSCEVTAAQIASGSRSNYRLVRITGLSYPLSMVIEKIFVTREDLTDALDPSGGAADSAVRRLRENGLVSHGIELRVHSSGRLRGANVYYCALNLDAAGSVRDGDRTTARKLAEAAGSIESSPTARELAKVFSTENPRTLSAKQRRTVSSLARRIARERTRVGLTHGPFVGVVWTVDEWSATVVAGAETIVLPRETLEVRGLDKPGTPVAIRSHRLKTGAMVHSAEEALAFDAPERGGARKFDPFEMRREQRDPRRVDVLGAALSGEQPVRLLAPLVVR
jgi:hypothetical protein